MLFLEETHSLKAISELEKKDFPYAATLLVYVVLERCLKLYLFHNRDRLTDKEVELEESVGTKKKKLVDYRERDDAAFIRDFLVDCTLRSMEIIYRMPDKKYSTHRNDIFHSNLYIGGQGGEEYPARRERNRQHLEKAKAHLIEASRLYFHQPITESGGALRFE